MIFHFLFFYVSLTFSRKIIHHVPVTGTNYNFFIKDFRTFQFLKNHLLNFFINGRLNLNTVLYKVPRLFLNKNLDRLEHLWSNFCRLSFDFDMLIEYKSKDLIPWWRTNSLVQGYSKWWIQFCTFSGLFTLHPVCSICDTNV